MPVTLSAGEISFIQSGIARNIRMDGRTRTETREVSIETGSIKTAYGSSHAILGSGHGSTTEVVVAVYAQVVPSAAGRFWFHVDPTPLAASSGGPVDASDRTKESYAAQLEAQLTAIYGADRPSNKNVHSDATLIFLNNAFPEDEAISIDGESAWEIHPKEHLPTLPTDWPSDAPSAIDRETLRAGEGLGWCLKISVLIIGNSGGNVILAATSAVNAALRDTKFPQVEQGVEGSAEVKLSPERTVPIQKIDRLPLASLVLSIKNFYVIDPSALEEQLPRSKGYVVAVDPDGGLEAFLSCATSKTSLPVSMPDMMCILGEVPVLLKALHKQIAVDDQ